MVTFFKFLGRLCILLGIPVFVGALVYWYMDSVFFEPADAGSKKRILFEVPPRKTFKEVCKILEEKGLVSHWFSIYYISKIRGSNRQIKAGEYSLSPSFPPKMILEELLSGKVYMRKVVVKPGMRLPDIAEAVEKAGLVSKKEFLERTVDSSFLIKAGLTGHSFEGYLAPGKYEYVKGESSDRIIWGMLENGERGWTPDFQKRAEELGFSRDEIIILASIIEKETENSKAEEKQVISSVLHNRLRNAMKLWSRATVAYGLEKFSEPLTDEDLKKPSPYNTFINYGLPQAPICSPSNESLFAALYPEETTYLFFVPDGLGSHVFARTEREYRDAVRKMAPDN